MSHQIETIKKMKSLKEKLSKELEAFKTVYLNNVKAYLKAEFVRIEAITENEIISSRGWTNRSGRKEHTKASFAYWSKINNQQRNGEDLFEKKGIETANQNFEKSILKVVEKCNKKGLEIENSNVIYYGIGNDGNPRFDITDKKKTVFCYTIIAFGEVQIPHYRFLIK